MIQTRKRVFLLGSLGLVAVLVMLVLAGCGGSEQPASSPPEGQEQPTGEKLVMRFPGTLTIGHHITRSQDHFEQLVEERTNGRVDIQVYPAQQLYADKDLPDVVPTGGVELAEVNFGFWSGKCPAVGIFDIGLLFDSTEHWYKFQDSEGGQMIAQLLEEQANVKLLGWLDYGEVGVIAVPPVKAVDDLKGLRLRIYGEYGNYMLEGIGAAPTTMSSSEVYTALQRQTLDGAVSGPTSFIDRKWYEVAKYALQPYGLLARAAFGIIANLDYWNSLPPDIQQVMLDAAHETNEWSRQECQQAEQKAWEQLKGDITVTQLTQEDMDKWREATLEPTLAEYRKRAGEETANKLLEIVESVR